jgi:hypothetical protein
MTTAMLIHHLLALLAHSPRIRHDLVTFYARQQPGLGRVRWIDEATGRVYGYGYAGLVKANIWQYPHAMRACAASFRGWHATTQSYRVCP